MAQFAIAVEQGVQIVGAVRVYVLAQVMQTAVVWLQTAQLVIAVEQSVQVVGAVRVYVLAQAVHTLKLLQV